jgi:hypothetical protein
MTSARRLPVCPACGEAVGDELQCEACGENLARYEKLPLRGDWEMEQKAIGLSPRPTTRSLPQRAAQPKPRRQPSPCPMCYATGRNKRGGPCGYCQATGQVSGLAAAGATLSALGGALTALFWSGVALAIIVVILIAVLKGH